MKKYFVLFILFFLPIFIFAQDIENAKKLLDEKKYKEAKAELEKLLDRT